jgi:hypothetical protein
MSNPPLVIKVVCILALPVIFISGSINTTVCARYLWDLFDRNIADEDVKKVSVTVSQSSTIFAANRL